MQYTICLALRKKCADKAARKEMWKFCTPGHKELQIKLGFGRG
jgi:hypothetical protein